MNTTTVKFGTRIFVFLAFLFVSLAFSCNIADPVGKIEVTLDTTGTILVNQSFFVTLKITATQDGNTIDGAASTLREGSPARSTRRFL